MMNQSSDNIISFKHPQLICRLLERRRSDRQNIHMLLKYQLPRQEMFEDGVLHNLSETGMLITIKHWATEGDTIQLILEPESSNERPLVVDAVIVRTSSPAPGGNFTYGCRIQHVWDLNLLP